jgi:hypothetical protein
MKNVFWDVALCRSWVNRRFGGTYRLHLQGRKIREQRTGVSRWLQIESRILHLFILLLLENVYLLVWKPMNFFICRPVRIKNRKNLAPNTAIGKVHT